MAAQPYVTFESKNIILDKNGTTILKKITVCSMFMAELVEAEVLDGYESTDIQALKVPGEMRDALMVHLRNASSEAFLAFCIVLVDKQNRLDIVKSFGLDINQIRSQKRQMEAERQERQEQSNSQEALPVAAANGVTSTSYCLWDEENKDYQTMLKRTGLYKTHVFKNYAVFVEDVCLDNLWTQLKCRKILNKANLDRVKVEKTSMDKVFKLMEILETSPVWRFHALLKALCEDDQSACITSLGLNAANYKDVKKAQCTTALGDS